MKRYSLQKLFQQTFEDHEGRPGEVGGSLPRTSGGKARAEKKASRFDTPKKAANTLQKLPGVRFSKSHGNDSLVAHTTTKKMGSVERSLKGMGFEAYKDELKQDWVKSYRSGDITVHLAPDDDDLLITVSKSRGTPHIPYD